LKIYLLSSWVLTDEHPEATRGNPILVDPGTWKSYRHGDKIEAISALQVVSRAVEEMGENTFLPAEIDFISRFKRGNHQNQSAHVARMGNKIKPTYEEIEFFRRG
jgi:hypothetical protein